jgi:hypothetical protein
MLPNRSAQLQSLSEEGIAVLREKKEKEKKKKKKTEGKGMGRTSKSNSSKTAQAYRTDLSERGG